MKKATVLAKPEVATSQEMRQKCVEAVLDCSAPAVEALSVPRSPSAPSSAGEAMLRSTESWKGIQMSAKGRLSHCALPSQVLVDESMSLANGSLDNCAFASECSSRE